jgi:(p)ppGpp synthase/HD superfamily hydrolase
LNSQKPKKNTYRQRNIRNFCTFTGVFGLYALRTELEDLSLKYLNRRAYEEISKEQEKFRKQNQELYYDFCRQIRTILKGEKISEVKLRYKTFMEYIRSCNHLEMKDIVDFASVKLLQKDITTCRSNGFNMCIYKCVRRVVYRLYKKP